METKAQDIMSVDLLTATKETTIEEALKLLVNNRITGMPVVDRDGGMLGVVSEYDILIQIAGDRKPKSDIFQRPIQFSKDIITVKDSTPLETVIDKFLESKYRRLPVVNKSGKLVGIITRRDLMRVFYYRAKLG